MTNLMKYQNNSLLFFLYNIYQWFLYIENRLFMMYIFILKIFFKKCLTFYSWSLFSPLFPGLFGVIVPTGSGFVWGYLGILGNIRECWALVLLFACFIHFQNSFLCIFHIPCFKSKANCKNC